MKNNSLRKIRIAIIITISCIFTTSMAQDFPSEIFHDGKVVLNTGDTIKGKVKYDLSNDLVEVITGGVVQALTSRKVLSFTIFDETVDMFRTFYSVPYNRDPDYKVPMLFEVLYEGSLSLLARESIVQETVPQYSYYYRSSYNLSRPRLSYNYFFLDKKGNFFRFTMKKAELLEIMHAREPQIKQYIKKNRLKVDLRRDLIRIVSYYNSLLGG